MLKRIIYFLLFALIIVCFFSFYFKSKTTPKKQYKGLDPPQYLAKKMQKKEPNTLKLIFAGDIMSQQKQIDAAHLGNGIYDYTLCFQYLRPILETADIAFGNLECTLPGKPPYTGGPNFKSPDQLAKALKINGFDVLVTANNHIMDSGVEGILHTQKTIKDNGFLTTGIFKDSLERALKYPLIIYKNGFKLALLNYTLHTNSHAVLKPIQVNLFNRFIPSVDQEGIKRDIVKAKKLKPDFIIMFMHWGIEHRLEEDAYVRSLSKQMFEWGADLVVGAHPHVVQPIKNEQLMINGKSQYCLTAYSLGNLISAQPFPNTEGGILFEVDLKKENNSVAIADYHYMPVIRYTPVIQGKEQYFALPISPVEGNETALSMPKSEKIKMDNFAKKFRAHLEKHGAKERKFGYKELYQ
jgi:poly-gamma-glutamate capsule biosynthesis protein CapA/YwtB (metallophosphatase superfamily)